MVPVSEEVDHGTQLLHFRDKFASNILSRPDYQFPSYGNMQGSTRCEDDILYQDDKPVEIDGPKQSAVGNWEKEPRSWLLVRSIAETSSRHKVQVQVAALLSPMAQRNISIWVSL